MQQHLWLIYALLSAVAASFVAIFGKLGMKGIDSTLATTIRSVVMTLFLVALALLTGLGQHVRTVHSRAMTMIILSGIAGATSWLFYFKALHVGQVSRVAPIDKLSMPLGILLAVMILGERPGGINWLGILMIAVGAYLAGLPPRP